MITDCNSRSARSKKAAVRKKTTDPLIALFCEHSTRVRAQVDASRDARRKETQPLCDTLAQWLTLHFTVIAQRMTQAAGGEGLSCEDQRKLTACLAALREGDDTRERIKLERKHLAQARNHIS